MTISELSSYKKTSLYDFFKTYTSNETNVNKLPLHSKLLINGHFYGSVLKLTLVSYWLRASRDFFHLIWHKLLGQHSICINFNNENSH